MPDETFKIIAEKYDNGFNGDALLINLSNIRGIYDYIGLWYARDGNDKTSITTEIYYGSEQLPIKPLDFTFELKENNFMQIKRHKVDISMNWVWIATRIDNNKYCRLKRSSEKEGRLYINYKVINNKAFGFDVLASGILKGGNAYFFPLGSEDMTGEINYTDAIMYIVLMKNIPPEDWGIDHTFIGVEHLPIFTPTCKFVNNRKYSNWFDQNPLSIV